MMKQARYLKRLRSAAADARRRANEAFPYLLIWGSITFALAISLGLLFSALPENRLGFASVSASLFAVWAYWSDFFKSSDERSVRNPRGFFACLGLLLGLVGMFMSAVNSVGSALLLVAQAILILVLAIVVYRLRRNDDPKFGVCNRAADRVLLSKQIRLSLLIACAVLIAMSMLAIAGAPIGLDPSYWSAAVNGYVIGAFALFPPFRWD